MDKNSDTNKKYFPNYARKKQNAIKSINNYLSQLKMHFELSDEELFDIIKTLITHYKKNIISSKKWWHFFN